MTHANSTNPQQTVPGQTCGNCGAVSASDAVTCPACGVLLAAYQAPVGATAASEAIPAAYDSASPNSTTGAPSDTSATRDVPSAQMTSPVEATPVTAPVVHRPRSQSPIADALKRTQSEDAETSAIEESDAAAAELEAMAADESDFSREVEAELAGAKVTFDGNTAVLTTEADVSPSEEVPVVDAVAPASPVSRPSQPVRTAPRYENPVTVDTAPDAGSKKPPTNLTGYTRWIPIVVVFLVFLSFARGFPAMGSVLGLVFAAAVLLVLLKLASMGGRKTTSMPRDDRWNPRRRR